MARKLLFLDFDGVLCDSIDECFVSSWVAYHRLEGRPLPDRVPIGSRARFAAMRPFIRSGEDYVLIQRLVERGVQVTDQAAFDARIAELGRSGMQRLREAFYEARGELLSEDRSYWLSLNRLYPHVVGPLQALAGRNDVFVLSTKRSEFILEILAANGIRMPSRRVVHTGDRTKLAVVLSMMGEDDRAVLVDDQVDHLLAARDPRVEVRLALWGYIKPEWLVRYPEIPRVTPEDFAELVAPWLTPPRPADGAALPR